MLKEVIKCFISGVTGWIVGTRLTRKILENQLENEKSISSKNRLMFLLMNQWVRVKQQGKEIDDYLIKKGCKEIAIYGMSYIGETLFEELRNSKVTVKYGIDKSAKDIYAEVLVVNPQASFEKVDAVIVTSIICFDEIVNDLTQKIDCPIWSIEDILYEI